MRAPNFRRHLQAARPGLIAASLLLLIEALVATLLPLPVMALIDGLLVPTGLESATALQALVVNTVAELLHSFSLQGAMLTLSGVLMALTVLAAVLDFFERVSLTRLSYRVVESLREDLIGRLMTRRQSYLERKRKSELVARLSNDAGALEHLITSSLSAVARAVPTFFLLFAVLAALNPRLALLILAALPIPYILNLRFSRVTRAHVARLRGETQHFESEASHLLSAAPIVKSLTLESFAMRSLHERLEEMGRHLLNLRRTDGALIASIAGSRHLLRVMLLLIGGAFILNGTLSLGALAVFLIAVGPLSRAVSIVAQFISDYGRAETSLERIESLFRDMEGAEELQGSQALISLPFPDATTLHFEDVTFAYPGAAPLLSGFREDFHAGELLALMGPSGSGRTTFGRLINRLLDPVDGRLLLGRNDLKRFRLEVLRTYVTVVDADPFFIPGTVRENLLLGAETSEIREQQISEALHAVNAYNFIQALPDKLETVIGEGGFELSSSQQRRLSFARALLREQSQIFVLDEPTLGLDPDSASAVVTAINRIAERGAMVFWITNRLEEIRLADRVVFFGRMGNPRVGSHEKLLREDPTYRSYFTAAETARTLRDRNKGPEYEV